MLYGVESAIRARLCSFGGRSAIKRRARPSSSESVLRPKCGPDFTRFGLAENDVGVTETMRLSRTATDWGRWCPSHPRPHGPDGLAAHRDRLGEMVPLALQPPREGFGRRAEHRQRKPLRRTLTGAVAT